MKGSGDDLEESFKIGDFSTKHLRRASLLETEPQGSSGSKCANTVNADDSKATKIEGGFNKSSAKDLGSHDEPQKDTHEGTSNAQRHSRGSISGISTLISESLRKDTPIIHQPSPQLSHQNLEYPSRPGSRLSGRLSPMKPTVLSSEVDVRNPDQSVLDTISRHLVSDSQSIISNSNNHLAPQNSNDEQFDSLQLQGGDTTRELYNWKRAHSPAAVSRRRSMSFSGSIGAASSTMNSVEPPDFAVHDIRVPGGFRRSFIVQKATKKGLHNGDFTPPTFVTRNFIEFLTLYGHFAGEELSDDEDEDEEEGEGDRDADEESLLLQSVPRRQREEAHKATSTKAVMLLLKSFIGTGVLFLPRGARNAGWLFSTTALLFFSILSYYCFMLLINTKTTLGKGSYGDLGGVLFGSNMRLSILCSIVLSQIGFAAAYIVFTATNLQAFTHSVFDKLFSIEFFIIAQMVVFIPLSLTRNITKLSFTALIADLFIFLGLIYVYFYCSTVQINNGIAPIRPFNKDWTVFIGTAIFTYEGIGLLIPIQESMKQPSKFPMLLFWVMVTVTVVFVSAGLVGYLAFGDDTQTVILLNFPQNSPFVSATQFLYAMAILLSTPLQLFPAIKILEHGIFKRSGKYNTKVKWRKNTFRAGLVFITALAGWGGASNLDKFVSVIGSVACVPLIYVYPPLLHSKLDTTTSRQKIADYALFCLGMVMMVYTSAQTLLTWNE